MSVPTTGQVVGALDRAAHLALTARADLDAQLRTLDARVALGSRWQGEGGRAFAAAYAAWARQQSRVTAELQTFADRLAAVERLNVGTDQAQAAVLGALAHRFEG